MISKISSRHSLRNRVTVFTLVTFILSIWSLSFYISRNLRADMEQMLGEQQLSVVTAMAKEVNQNLTQRLQALEKVAKATDADLLARPVALQTRLEQRPLLQLLFNAGAFVTDLQGTAIADVSDSANRIGVNYMERDFIVATLKEGKSAIGRPVMGKQLKAPVLVMSVPVHDVQGKVIGALAGVTSLGEPNFLDTLSNSPYGKTGGYLLIAPQHNLFVTASDKSRIMQPLPAPGINTMHDRYMQGYEGYGIAVNSRGIAELNAAKAIPAAGWFLGVVMPTAEAFAPIYAMQQRLLWATLLLTLLTGVLTWLVLKRELAPVVETASAMAALADTRQMPQPLALTHPGEIGQLVTGFNRILQTWKQREETLQKSEQNLAITLNSIGDAVIATDVAGLITHMNPTAERLTDWPLADALGQPLTDVFRIISAQTRLPAPNPVQRVMVRGEVVGLANHTVLQARDGREYQIADSAAPIRNAANDIVGVVLVFSDVSEKYRVELALRESEQQYRSLLENLSSGVVVHRADTTVVMANAMAAHLQVLTQDQLLGKAAFDPDWCFVQEDGTPMPLEDYPVNLVLNSGEPLKDYVVGVRHPGRAEPTWVICNAYPARDDKGKLLQVVVTFTDISLRKKAELALQQRGVMMERTESLARLASFEWEVESNIVTWSPEMFRLFGRDPALGIPNLEGQAQLYTPESTQALFEAVGKAVAEGTPYTIELMTVQPGGEQRPCIARGFPERDAGGRVVRLVGLVQDVTERKQAEAALVASEQRWKFAIEGAGDGLWDWNVRTGAAFYSPRYKQMFGYTDADFGTTSDEWSKRIHSDDAPGVFATLQPYMEGKPGSAMVEFRMLCKDGSWMWTLGRGMVVERDADGKPLRMIGTNADISERKRTQEAIERRILALTQPITGGRVAFDELFSLDEIQRIQDEFAFAMGVASIITHPDGTPITAPSNFTPLCSEIIRKTERGCANCFKSDAAIGRFNPAGPIVQQCLSGGLWDAGASINLGGYHLANWLIGQVRDETQTDDSMRAYAREIGANEAAFMDAFYKVPAMSRDRFEIVAKALFTFSNQLSLRAYQNVQQARFIAERKQTEEKLQLAASVFTHALEGILITAPDATIIDVNEAFTRITGYSRDEAVGQKPSILKSGRHDRDFYAAMWSALTGQGHWSGEVWNRRKNGEVFAELLTVSSVRDAAGNIQQYVALFSDITASKEHQNRLEHIAHFDALTNLPNRVLLADRLQQAMTQAQRRQQQVAVAFLDLDGFKAINDHHGHVTGDQVLITLARRMKDALREGDTLARIGGDEFVAVLIDLEDSTSSVPLLSRLLAAAALPVHAGDLAPQVSASVGVTFYPQAHDIDADQLLRQADQAMYQAKVAGKNRYCVFDAAQDSSMRFHHESLECIRLALENHELVLHYQPKVNMHSGQVMGAEALIRWQHPERGLLAPAAFLPVIEDHPLAVAVGEWVIDTALTQIGLWQACGLDMPVSVNIGARQLQQGNFVQRLQAILARHPQVNPASLELEVLETSALADTAQVSQVIEDCARIGVTFALDDFGTGYSSLTYLKRLRVTLLKIDQSFVRDMLDDPDDLAILQGIISLAAAFRREVIAEGVETVAHGTALLQLGCELAQGYGIARPMPPEQLPAWVASWQPDAAWCGVPPRSDPT